MTTFTHATLNVYADMVHEDIKKSLENNDFDRWKSLKITKRKPHTFRVFTEYPNAAGINIRVCLHKFERCGEHEPFWHPHPWPGSFLMLDGAYVHKIGYTPDLESGEPIQLCEELVRPYTMYSITNKQTWHCVQPLTTSYTIMINGEPWEDSHSHTRTTKGKDLETMADDELKVHLSIFDLLIRQYKENK